MVKCYPLHLFNILTAVSTCSHSPTFGLSNFCQKNAAKSLDSLGHQSWKTTEFHLNILQHNCTGATVKSSTAHLQVQHWHTLIYTYGRSFQELIHQSEALQFTDEHLWQQKCNLPWLMLSF